MDALLDHIGEFSKFIKSHKDLKDEQLQEEWQLFKNISSGKLKT